MPLSVRVGQSLFALLILGVFAYVVYQAKFGFGALEPRAALFPLVVGVPGLLLAIYVFFKDLLQRTRKVETAGAGLYTEPEVDPILERQRTVSIGCWIVGCFPAVWGVGFYARLGYRDFAVSEIRGGREMADHARARGGVLAVFLRGIRLRASAAVSHGSAFRLAAGEHGEPAARIFQLRNGFVNDRSCHRSVRFSHSHDAGGDFADARFRDYLAAPLVYFVVIRIMRGVLKGSTVYPAARVEAPVELDLFPLLIIKADAVKNFELDPTS